MTSLGMSDPPFKPVISVIVLNYNGARWMQRCLETLRQQTIFTQIEVIVADNLSSDGSDTVAERILQGWPNGRFVQNGENLGFCEGNNRPAQTANGEYLFFLNNDTWLESDCLEKLLVGAQRAQAAVATPLVLNYSDDAEQRVFVAGFDIFGLASFAATRGQTQELFMPPGCSYLIKTDLFRRLGGFDSEFFMYGDDMDLSWRIWIAGATAVVVTSARMHHRGAANVNPEGGSTVVELRTSASTRYYSNRNSLLVILKNARHVLLLLAVLQVGLYVLEAAVALVVVRQWSFVKRAYLEAVTDCWRLRHHVCTERRRLRPLRKRGDWQMLRFLRLKPNRWDELVQVWRRGFPKVSKH